MRLTASIGSVAALSGRCFFNESGNDFLSINVLALVLAKFKNFHFKWAAYTFVTLLVAKGTILHSVTRMRIFFWNIAAIR